MADLDRLRQEFAVGVKQLQQEASKQSSESLLTRIKGISLEGKDLKQQIESGLEELQSPTTLEQLQVAVAIRAEDLSTAFGVLRDDVKSMRIGFGGNLLKPLILTVGSLGILVLAPIWRFFNRTSTLRLNQLKEEIGRSMVDVWVGALKDKYSQHVVAIGLATTEMANEVFQRYMAAEEAGFDREREEKGKPENEEAIARKIAVYGNLIAAEAALEFSRQELERFQPSVRDNA